VRAYTLIAACLCILWEGLIAVALILTAKQWWRRSCQYCCLYVVFVPFDGIDKTQRPLGMS